MWKNVKLAREKKEKGILVKVLQLLARLLHCTLCLPLPLFSTVTALRINELEPLGFPSHVGDEVATLSALTLSIFNAAL